MCRQCGRQAVEGFTHSEGVLDLAVSGTMDGHAAQAVTVEKILSH